jgi:hypothetical protein
MLIAPLKFVPKGDSYLWLESVTTQGYQARTINRPIIWAKTEELIASIPFSYGIDNRYFDGAHVHIKEISLKYMKHIKSSFDTSQVENLTTYQGSMFDVAVETVTLKVLLGDEDPESDSMKYGVSLPLPWSDFETILPGLWAGCIDEWDRQLKVEYEAIQLSLLQQDYKDLEEAYGKAPNKVKPLKLDASDPETPRQTIHVPDDVDIAAYHFEPDQLEGRRGMLTGNALIQRQLKLIRTGEAKPKNDDAPPPPFGFHA